MSLGNTGKMKVLLNNLPTIITHDDTTKKEICSDCGDYETYCHCADDMPKFSLSDMDCPNCGDAQCICRCSPVEIRTAEDMTNESFLDGIYPETVCGECLELESECTCNNNICPACNCDFSWCACYDGY